MNRSEKVDLILQDDRINAIQEQNDLLKMQNVIDGPGVTNEILSTDNSNETVKLGEREKNIFSIDIGVQDALVINYIANDWYPGMEYEIEIDGEILGPFQRQIAPTNDPLEVTYMARERIVWRASNIKDQGGKEDRTVEVVTGGKFIPVEVYDKYIEMNNQYGMFSYLEDQLRIE